MVAVRRPRSPTLIVDGPIIDDNCSVSSTITVSNNIKRRVQFDLSHNISYESNITPEESRKTWYRTKDYRIFRACAVDAAQQIMSFEARNRAPFSYKRVLEQTYVACSSASDETKQVLSRDECTHLERWMEVASSRVGLEKWSIRSISADKAERRAALTQAVLNLQASSEMSEQESFDVAEFLRCTCESISRPSRLFARTMAQAQAAAIVKVNFFDTSSVDDHLI
jgi:hypothetical protein